MSPGMSDPIDPIGIVQMIASEEEMMDKFMKAAFEEAQKGYQDGGIPIGSVLVCNDQIISRGHNRHIQEDNRLLHAEIVCLQNAKNIASFENTTMFTTLMPCFYCGGAIVQFGIQRVVSGETVHGEGSKEFLKSFGIMIEEEHTQECVDLLDLFISQHPEVWHADCGIR